MRASWRFLPLLYVGVLAACDVCGNNKQEPGEECDDGNRVDTDACTSLCQSAACGDGFVFEAEEACDDGNTDGGDGCSADCQSLEVCGDGVINQRLDLPQSAAVVFAGTSCSGVTETFSLYVDALSVPLSLTPECTCNPQIQTQEITDPAVLQKLQQPELMLWVSSEVPGSILGWLSLELAGLGARQIVVFDAPPAGTAEAYSNDLCTGGMTDFFSGEVLLDNRVGEECDDGNANNTDACPDGEDGTCEAARCGDGFVYTGVEDCDDGNTNDGDSCPSTCDYCDLSGDCLECMSCAVGTTCHEQQRACEESADYAAFEECASSCQDEICMSQCATDHPEGAALYIELWTCLTCDACYVDCDGSAVCS